MCSSCWTDAGRPTIDTPEVRRASDLVAALYELAPTGARAHSVTDDWNLEDHNIDWCLAQERHAHSSEAEDEAAIACLKALRELSLVERSSALALEADYWAAT